MEIKSIIQEIVKDRQKKGGIHSIYFVACGGSLASFYPAKVFVEIESKKLRCGWYNSGEFIHNPPAGLGENSVVIVASHRGNTPETIQAAKTARKAGSPVIALTWIPDSEISKNCDYLLGYTYGDDKDIAGEKTMVGLKLAVELVHQIEGYKHYEKFYDGVSKIDAIVKKACKQVEKRAEAFAENYKNENLIYTIGSGPSWGSAYIECICILMEMQWINSSCINSGEYFHGPFEITDANTVFMIQIAEGKTRPVDERALKFLKQYAKRYEVLDAKELGLSVIDADVIDYFNHSLFNNVFNVYNHKLADARQHPLTTRRYMWKVEY
ncbi:MAG TPA: SIS domain-containing protein [Clostridiaceae bacterium]|nr:SIS domain-containing protein [Clostridiaceae bacterium]